MFNKACMEGHNWPKGADVRKKCIRFHSKEDWIRDWSLLHSPLHLQVQADYIWFLRHCQAGYEANTFTQTHKSSGGVQNSYPDRCHTKQQHRRIRGGERHSINRGNRNFQNWGTGRDNGHHGENGGGPIGHRNTPKLTHPQDRQRQQCGKHTNCGGGRLATPATS